MAKRKQTSGAIKRAAIYIRVSSERQADPDKVSPQSQESDCRSYCESKGYIIAEIYKDTEKYRVNGRLVEPSGTRGDRPQLKRMFADIDAGKIDIVIAWREDRLYRGANRAMMELSERVKEKKIEIELVKEHYDPSFAPVKAWAAGMELEAKHDRTIMGVAGRLAKGKSWNNTPAYGYRRDSAGRWEIDPEEAQWVKKMFEWYDAGLARNEIRKRLIEAGAKQKGTPKQLGLPRLTVWMPVLIDRLLRREYYWTGEVKTDWGGKVYVMNIPPIIDSELAKRVSNRKAKNKKRNILNVKRDYLLAGLVHCGVCKTKMSAFTLRKGKSPASYNVLYRCTRKTNQSQHPNCPKQFAGKKLEDIVWAKLWSLFAEPDKFMQLLEARIEELKTREIDAEAECDKLQAQLDKIAEEEQVIITWGRKNVITKPAMETQLMALGIQTAGLKRELDDMRLLVGNHAERLIEVARLYREHVLTGAVGVNDDPISPEDAKRKFEIKKKFVDGLVKDVVVSKDRKVKVITEINFSEIAHKIGIARNRLDHSQLDESHAILLLWQPNIVKTR